jgi:peptidoglycan/xylan/chitin deacetylase (PgdA/CDA1 family)
MGSAISPFRLLSPGGSRGKLNIFIFHRVRPEPDTLFPTEMDAERFDAYLRFARSWLNVLPLSEAVERLRDGALPPAATCITFDDGYADNLTVAAPLLQKYGLPATVFVATGYIDGGRMWNDWVIDGIKESPLDRIDLRDLDLPDLDIGTPDRRRHAVETLLPKVKYLPLPRRTIVCEEVARRGRSDLGKALMMTREQVTMLPEFGITVGAHTHTHPILASESLEYCRTDIKRSKDTLEGWLQRPVDTFAYPNGVPGTDYRPEHVQLVRSLGFTCAVSTSVGYAERGADVFQLPRFTPWGRNVPAVAIHLGRHLAAPSPNEIVGARP